VTGVLPLGVTAKDIVLGVIGRTGTSAGQGHLVEYRGATIEGLSMEGRMTICNMSIEWGAKAGMVAPDDTTFSYVEGKPHAPKGAAWEKALDHWRSLKSDEDAHFDGVIDIDASKLEPHVTWGTTPAQVVPVTGRALRVDIEWQVRRTAGLRRAHAADEPPGGGGGSEHRSPRRRAGAPLKDAACEVRHRTDGAARPRRRRHRPDHPQAVLEA